VVVLDKMVINLPLEVWYSPKKKFILNLNNYRNAHHQVLAKAKKQYTKDLIDECNRVKSQVKALKPPLLLVYAYYPGDKREYDTANPCSIIDKFACDALITYGLIEDDNHKIVRGLSYWFEEVDKNNPRCELTIHETSV